MQKLDLNGAWEMRQAGAQEWLPAVVPGCNYSDLLAAGKIEDPFVETNELKDLWVAEQDWEYRKRFTVEEQMLAADEVVLYCEQLDTICDVFLNDRYVGSGENSHRIYQFPVTQFVEPGENVLRVCFKSPLAYTQMCDEKDRMPKAANSDVAGIPHIRKAQCHFGWDWGPKLPVSGITRGISLRGYETAKVTDLEISQQHQNGAVHLTVCCRTQLLAEKKCRLTVTLVHPDGTRQSQSLPVQAEVTAAFQIDRPALWWTRELSGRERQPLYTVEAALTSGRKKLDVQSRRIGLRTIELNRDMDQWGRNFQFRLNGIPIFAKGADWIPADSFINRFTEKEIAYYINSACRANMNMIRIWGGGYYESDAFYDACDERGILLWQDFGFACAPYPFYHQAFLENVKKEVRDNVRRLRHHASLALWCGNNEIESMSPLWAAYGKLTKWTERFFYHILPEEVRRYDGAHQMGGRRSGWRGGRHLVQPGVRSVCRAVPACGAPTVQRQLL